MKMPKTLDNFIKEVKKLDKYLILKEEKDKFLIIGTKIKVKLHIEILGNVFQPHQRTEDSEFYVYFKVAFTQKVDKPEDFDYLPIYRIDTSLLTPPKEEKDKKMLKTFHSERKPIVKPITMNEFDLLDSLERFIDKTYLKIDRPLFN